MPEKDVHVERHKRAVPEPERRWYGTRIEYELQQSIPGYAGELDPESRRARKIDRKLAKVRREIADLRVPEVDPDALAELLDADEPAALAALDSLGREIRSAESGERVERALDEAREELDAERYRASPEETRAYGAALGEYAALRAQRERDAAVADGLSDRLADLKREVREGRLSGPARDRAVADFVKALRDAGPPGEPFTLPKVRTRKLLAGT